MAMKRDCTESIIVDIDNTLWDFASQLYDKLKDYGIPEKNEWKWDFWSEYVSDKIFYRVVNEIHVEQADGHAPFPEAGEFLASLKEEGFYIIIASHREKTSEDVTRHWLLKNKLAFDELHLSNDKSVLFDREPKAVIDDHPGLLQKASQKGIIATGLEYSWNANRGLQLFTNLNEVFLYLARCL